MRPAWARTHGQVDPISVIQWTSHEQYRDEPPTADPHGGWCGGRGLEAPGYPIRQHSFRLGKRLGHASQASRHELTNGAANYEQLPIVHAAKYVADDRSHHLLHASHAKGGRLLHNEVCLGGLERLQKVLV